MNYPNHPNQFPQPPRKRRRWPWLVVPATVLLCGFGGCAAILSSSDDIASGTPAAVDAGGGAPGTDTEFAPAGSAVRDGKFEFQVTKVERGEQVSWSSLVQHEAQGQFVLTHVTVTNIADEAQFYFGQNQTLIDTQGRKFTNDTLAEAYVNEPGATSGEINPGNTITVVLVFDIAEDAQPAAIEFHDSAFSGGATVALS